MSNNSESTLPTAHPSHKGYTYVPHYDQAPNNIYLRVGPHQIIDGPRRRRANLIVEEPTIITDPRSYEEVRQRSDASDWIAAEDSELKNITRHGVWEVAEK